MTNLVDMKKVFFITFISSICLLLLINPVLACGPFFPTYIHTPDDLKDTHHLNIDFKTNFSDIDSQNQIIFENLEPQYLYPLYRKMAGKPLSVNEKQVLYFYDQSVPTWVDTELSEAIKQWKSARSKFLNDNPQIDQYGICFPATFKNAVETLQNRQNTYTKDEIVEWIKNQDAVFAKCDFNIERSFQNTIITATTTNEIINQPVGFFGKIKNFFSAIFNFIFNKQTDTKQQPAIVALQNISNDVFETKYSGQLQYDYEYQQAAKAYYGGERAKAEKFFTLIFNNPKHPWNAQSAYTLGLLYIISDDYSKAEQQFNNIIADPKYSEFHQAAKGQLDYILAQRDPFALFKKVENILTTSNDTTILKQALTDYLYFWPYPYFYLYSQTADQKDIDFEKRIMADGNDMSQWILVWQHYQPEYLNIIKEKYKENKTDQWLLALARFLPTTDIDYKNVETRVSLLPKSSVAYWTANYYIIKKAIDEGQIGKAKQLISKLPNNNLPVVLNDYLENFKMQTASSLVELFKHSERRTYTTAEISGFTTEAEDKIIAEIPFLDNKAKAIFESKIPLSKQLDLVLRNDVFGPKQTEFLRLVTMVRAFLLKDYDSAREIALVLAKNNAEIEKDLSNFIFATTNEDKEFYAVVFMLRYPGIGVRIYDDAMVDKSTESSVKNTALYGRSNYKEIFNYNEERWDYCQPTQYAPSKEDDQFNDNGTYVPIYTWQNNYNLDFAKKIITNSDQEEAKQELNKIFQQVPANYFASVVLSYAKSHPNNTAIPEALHNVVLSTKFAGCSDDKTSSFSQKAFQMLHSKYPKSYWTKQTPYHY